MSGSGRGAWRRERACSAAKARSCAKYAAESPSVPGARVCPARKSAFPNVTSSSDARSLIKASDTRAPSSTPASTVLYGTWRVSGRCTSGALSETGAVSCGAS